MASRRTESRRPIAKISGVGFSEISREFTTSQECLAADAVIAAVTDAGLQKKNIDGILINRSDTNPPDALSMRLLDDLGFRDLSFGNVFASQAACGVQMVQYAAMAVAHGMAKNIVCVFADTPILPQRRGGDAYAIDLGLTNVAGWERQYGLYGAIGAYGLAMRRYMEVNGAGAEAFAEVAMAARLWAQQSPLAFLTKPMTIDDYLSSKFIAEPLRMFDCAFPVNGGGAVVISSADAGDANGAGSAYIWGMGQGNRGYLAHGDYDNETQTSATVAGNKAYEMAGISPSEIDHAQIYDAFTLTTMLGLEGYGLCPPGEAKDFVRNGALAPGGCLPVNTGGGQLSGYYLQGMTQVSEGYLQASGRAGKRQVEKNGWSLVTAQGGRMDYHACLVLSSEKTH